jgi:uncharacterized sporulation protein YeaH/YhbH (DUF444 family)
MNDPEYHDDFHCLNCGHDVNDAFHTRFYEKWGCEGNTTPQRTLHGKLLRVWIHRRCKSNFKHPFLEAFVSMK